jgi:hypothetical protein
MGHVACMGTIRTTIDFRLESKGEKRISVKIILK